MYITDATHYHSAENDDSKPNDPALDFSNFKRLWKKVKKIWNASGYEDFRFHDLKHTYGSHTAPASGDMITHKAVIRHKSLKMMERYSHYFPERVRKAVLSLDNVLAVKPEVMEAIGAERVPNKSSDWTPKWTPLPL